MSEELRHNGRHALAFDRAWLVSHHNPPWLKGPKENPAGSVAYVFGEIPPRYPLPATFGQVLITSRNVYRANPQGWDSETYL